MHWMESHPWITGGAIVGGGLLLFLYWNSGSSTTQVVSTGPNPALQAAQLNAQTQLQLQGLQAQVALHGQDTALTAQNNQLAAALQAATLSAQGHTGDVAAAREVALQQLQTQLAGFGINAQSQANLAQINSGTQLGLMGMMTDAMRAQIDGNVTTARINAAVANNQISSQSAVLLAGIQAQLEASKSANDAAIAQANISMLGIVNIAGIQTAGATAQNASNNFTLQRTTESNNATQEFIAQQNKQISDNNNETARQLAKYNADVQAQIADNQFRLGVVQSDNQVNITGLIVGGQIVVSQQQNATMQHISDNQTNVSLAQIYGNTATAQAYAQAFADASRNQMWQGIVQSLIP